MSPKKKLIIVNNNLETGGIQRALVNLLTEIKGKYDITLFLFYKNGPYLDLIPKEIKVIEASGLLRILGTSKEEAKKLGFFYYLLRGFCILLSKVFFNHLPINILVSLHKKIGNYDIAISYLQNAREHIFYGGCNEFVLKRIESKKKITFCHCDFIRSEVNTKRNREIYRQFDTIVGVSEGCKKTIVEAMPDIENKTYAIRNFHNYDEYEMLSNLDTVQYDHNYLNIVTVARISSEKGLLRTVDVVKKLSVEGYKIKWHVIGDGPEKKALELKIKQLDLEENILLYGNQINPYRFIKNADIFLLPSFHEAAPMVIDEAKSLGVPVITTETISAREMVKSYHEGLVCENSKKGIYEGLKVVLDHSDYLVQWKKNLQEKIFSNEWELNKLEKLLGE